MEKGDRIAIIGDNRPEWVIAELAAQVIGALPLGLYQDSISAELASMLEAAEARVIVTPLKRRMYRWAMKEGEAAADARLGGRRTGVAARIRHRLADWTVFHPIRDQLGLNRVRCAYTGGAALGPDVFRFFHTIGVNLKQLYGQTEVSGISVVHRDGDIRFHTVGRPFPQTEIRISDEGEILCRGPAVFQGYFRNPRATAETLENGWLHSGDAGYFEEDGHLVVIDRLADVMKLPDGTHRSSSRTNSSSARVSARRWSSGATVRPSSPR